MQFVGMRTVFDSEVAYVSGTGVVTAMSTKQMMNFCDPGDAAQILGVALAIVPNAKLIGGTAEFNVTWNPGTAILTPGPDQIFAQADTSGGRYMYRTTDGFRPLRIQDPTQSLDQFCSELVASYNGETGMIIVNTAQGVKLQWQ